MALIRPVVLVYQEFATPTFTSVSPDLNCLVVGPAYWLQDYLDVNGTGSTDKADIRLSDDYGALEATPADAATPTGADAVVALEPPNNVAGALLDTDSVKVYFDQARVIIDSRTTLGNASTTLDSSIVDFPLVNSSAAVKASVDCGVDPAGTNGKWDATLEVLVAGAAGNSYTIALVNDGVTTPPVATIVGTAITVTYKAGDAACTVTNANAAIAAAGPVAAVIHVSSPGTGATVLDLGAHFGTTAFHDGADAVVGSAAGTMATGATKVLPGDRLIITDGAAHTIVRTVLSVVSDTELQLTSDVTAEGGFVATGTGYEWRIERKLVDQLVDASFVTVSSNAVSIAGSVTLSANGAAKTVSYARVYVAYRALRQDLQNLDTVTSSTDISAKVGRIDARNPLAVGLSVALANTTTPVQFFGVPSDNLAGHEACRDTISSRDDVYAIVPLSTDTTGVIAMWNADCVGLALPDESKGRPQRFRVVIGSGSLITTSVVAGPSVTGYTIQLSASAPAGTRLWTFPAKTLLTAGVKPGYTIEVSADVNGVSRNGTYTVVHLRSETVVEVAETIPAAATANVTIKVRNAAGAEIIASTAVVSAVSGALDDLFLILKDANATFIQSGVKAGDVLEIPQAPNDASPDYETGTLLKYTVASVLSDNRLQIVNNGNDTATVANELPHLAPRSGDAPLSLISQGAIRYQVIRNLSKDDQITALVQVAQSFKSRRTILVWPDSVLVSGVTGTQPGYYLACAVGGMTAGLPPHQGFTFLGVAAISQIFHANTYFTDLQMTDLMQGGWYVFNQANPAALPFTIHQLTTDPSTLESGEYSVVKNFDYVSMFFVDILQDFLGVYNITPEALTFLRAALNTGIDTLKLRTLAKIGPPLLNGTISSIGVSVNFADRIVIKLSIGLPKPLNTIELHLVA